MVPQAFIFHRLKIPQLPWKLKVVGIIQCNLSSLSNKKEYSISTIRHLFATSPSSYYVGIRFSSCLIQIYNNRYDVLFYNVHNHINSLVSHINCY